ncbi:MAG: radical SAM protein [Deltaproteobacteria bacterium]|nr:radical SAM protein [Deltaproteobacteria bacterium]
MFDAFSRPITYLRVSVTEHCNLRCAYCVPDDSIPHWELHHILRLDEIAAVVAYGVQLGIRKVRLTGGEPLTRPGIITLVEKLARLDGLDELTMTTNGTLLARYAHQLRTAGLHRLNISLDTVNHREYARITGGGRLEDVLAGIDAAESAGFTGIKINCVVDESASEPLAKGVHAFGLQRAFDVRFIRKMNPSLGEFWPVMGAEGGNCARCNRLRLSAKGALYPCLFSDVSFSVRELGIAQSFKNALRGKPECGVKSGHRFYQIGG